MEVSEVSEDFLEAVRVGVWLEKWESGSLGNSEGMRKNRLYVSMETVTIIESSAPGWGCDIKQITDENKVCHESQDKITKTSVIC